MSQTNPSPSTNGAPPPARALRSPSSGAVKLKRKVNVVKVSASGPRPTMAATAGPEVEFLASAPTETNAVLLKNAAPAVQGTTIVIYRSTFVAEPFLLWQIDPPVPNGGSPTIATTVWYDLFRVPTSLLASDRAAVAEAITALLSELGQQGDPGNVRP